jgi:hypothetical protein
MLFTKQYLVSTTAAAWDQFCVAYPEADHTWTAMKKLLYSRVAPTKHDTNAAFQKLCSARQGPDQAVTLFSAYIVTTCEGTNITNYNKHMFFWTGLHPEIHAVIRKGKNDLNFDACLEAGVEAETALRLDTDNNKAFKSTSRDRAQDKARKGNGKVCNDTLESRITWDAPQRLQSWPQPWPWWPQTLPARRWKWRVRPRSVPVPGQLQGLRQAGPFSPGLQN